MATKSTSPRDTEFRRIIEGYMAVSDLTKEKVAQNLNISHKCLCDRLKNPGTFRLMELRRLYDMLNIKEEDRQRLK